MSTTIQHPAASRVATHHVRLTRRGRLVVFTLSLLAILAVGVWLAAGSVATSQAQPTEVIVVGTGETLWDIAADVADDGDVRSTIAKIQQLNDLDGGMVAAGQRLRIPLA
ncbi:LysM peptidoglycan-binding domain-containing protein [Nocardioides kribbensis]|uniref:LysM peptidoglycan-binding domain-containing protein n=1 Tax=Nocardioides kribbensis TaxID=305517 RepID=A0ABV1NWU2_9ACTN